MRRGNGEVIGWQCTLGWVVVRHVHKFFETEHSFLVTFIGLMGSFMAGVLEIIMTVLVVLVKPTHV